MLAFHVLIISLLVDHVCALETRSSTAVNASILGDSKVSMAWYAGWHSSDFTLSDVSWSKYTHLAYAFAVTTPDVTRLSLEASDEELLPRFVQAAHQNNVKATLSIGGWTGSRYFSTNVGSAQNRSELVKTAVDVVKKYGLDGLDFDWEYPNRQGIGCNVISKEDTPNFLSFLQELRKDPVGSNLTLTAATSIQPWNNTDGVPSSDLSGFAQVLDFITIMNYDVWNSLSSRAGPNAPLNDTCVPTGSPRIEFGSAVSSVKAWSNAGFPLNQIVLGVPAYGHSFVVERNQAFTDGSNTQLASYPAFNRQAEHLGDSWDGEGGTDVCGAQVGPSGVYNFWGLMEQGYLNPDGSVKSGVPPYIYDSEKQTLISFDNVQSFTAKGDFIHSTGLRGFAIWEAGGDSNDILLDTILSATANGDPNKQSSSSSSSSNSASGTRVPAFVAYLSIALGAYSMHL
ncbi:glycoside hydrolase family 18 protein [Moniliophthora roreri]|uniref:Putative endochitinase n=1 Tax=Moniliophthora roreri TaxID=221103 RepID=A0A0W0EYK3_MONRR|nr:glycoside hydrolase family 18 protein [Moniliophthora roreri]